jgi:hypothetical protein
MLERDQGHLAALARVHQRPQCVELGGWKTGRGKYVCKRRLCDEEIIEEEDKLNQNGCLSVTRGGKKKRGKKCRFEDERGYALSTSTSTLAENFLNNAVYVAAADSDKVHAVKSSGGGVGAGGGAGAAMGAVE